MSITAVEQSNKEAILRAYGLGIPTSLAISDASAPTAYSAHASGGTTVTSNAATDLDTTAAALETLRDEVAALTVIVNAILAELN